MCTRGPWVCRCLRIAALSLNNLLQPCNVNSNKTTDVDIWNSAMTADTLKVTEQAFIAVNFCKWNRNEIPYEGMAQSLWHHPMTLSLVSYHRQSTDGSTNSTTHYITSCKALSFLLKKQLRNFLKITNQTFVPSCFKHKCNSPSANTGTTQQRYAHLKLKGQDYKINICCVCLTQKWNVTYCYIYHSDANGIKGQGQKTSQNWRSTCYRNW